MNYLQWSDDRVLRRLLNQISDLMEVDNDRNDKRIKAIVEGQIVPYMVSQRMRNLVVKFPQGGSMTLAIRNDQAEADRVIRALDALLPVVMDKEAEKALKG